MARFFLRMLIAIILVSIVVSASLFPFAALLAAIAEAGRYLYGT